MGVYCDMEPPFEQDGGWMRVAAVDMSDKNSQCPAGLVCDVISNKRTCGRSERFANGGCASIVLPVHNAPYKKVCGKVIGYQNKRPNGFGPSRENLLINETYVDGISITHGHPRQHIWTFAAAIGGDSVTAAHHINCPCLDYSQRFTGSIPNFVGNDYFCETGIIHSVLRRLKLSMVYSQRTLYGMAKVVRVPICAVIVEVHGFVRS